MASWARDLGVSWQDCVKGLMALAGSLHRVVDPHLLVVLRHLVVLEQVVGPPWERALAPVWELVPALVRAWGQVQALEPV
jgi:hypothetical protein